MVRASRQHCQALPSRSGIFAPSAHAAIIEGGAAEAVSVEAVDSAAGARAAAARAAVEVSGGLAGPMLCPLSSPGLAWHEA